VHAGLGNKLGSLVEIVMLDVDDLLKHIIEVKTNRGEDIRRRDRLQVES